MKQKPKRIVSKRKYVANLSIKVAGTSFGTVIFLIGCMFTLLTCFWGTKMLFNLQALLQGGLTLLVYLCAIGIFGSVSIVSLYFGVKIFKGAKETEVGIPLTRANTADLPAPDTLVRASAEPVQAQATILLRAARETTQGQEEQLVRAVER